MGRHPLWKKQKLAAEAAQAQAQAQAPPPQEHFPLYPPTIYETSPASLKNFPSSVVNGITEEGGLCSLTFKSIHCVKYVENNDYMKRIFKPQLELVELSNESLIGLKTQLEKDIQDETEVLHKPIDVISQTQKELDEILNTKGNFEAFGDNLKSNYKKQNPNKYLVITNDDYELKSIVIPNIEVDKVENSDGGMLIVATDEIVDEKPNEKLEEEIREIAREQSDMSPQVE